MLHLPSSKLQQQYSRALVLIIHAMLRKYPAIAHKYVAGPLMQPFLTATQEPGKYCTVEFYPLEQSWGMGFNKNSLGFNILVQVVNANPREIYSILDKHKHRIQLG